MDSFKSFQSFPFIHFHGKEGQVAAVTVCSTPRCLVQLELMLSGRSCSQCSTRVCSEPHPCHSQLICGLVGAQESSDGLKTGLKVPIWVTLEDCRREYFSQILFSLNLLSPMPFPLLFRGWFCPKDMLLPLVVMTAEWWTEWEYVTSLCMKDIRNKTNYSCIIKAQLPLALQAVCWGSVNICVFERRTWH